jgi:hypothetical protein
MDNIILLIFYILLTVFTYVIINFEKIKFSYNIVVGLINIWCFSILLYFKTQTDFNISFALFIFILSLIFQLNNNILQRRKEIKIISIGIVLISTILSLISCSSMVGFFILSFTQPVSYLFSFYLLKTYDKKYIFPIFINLIITWVLLILYTAWKLTH